MPTLTVLLVGVVDGGVVVVPVLTLLEAAGLVLGSVVVPDGVGSPVLVVFGELFDEAGG